MLKKTMFVVGALVAATVSMTDRAEARLIHSAYHRSIRPAARSILRPRAVFASAGHGRFARRRGRALAWRRPAAPRVAAVAAPSLFGLIPAPAAAPPVATPSAATPSALTPAAVAAAVAAPAAVAAHVVTQVATRVAARAQVGRASFYGGRSHTASGGFVGAATCAHRSLPFGTRVLVTNLANARRMVLTVNDRGPFVRGRIVDVSTAAASVLGMLHGGTAPVSVQVVGGPG